MSPKGRLLCFAQDSELPGLEPPLERPVPASRRSVESDTARSRFFEGQARHRLTEQHRARGVP